MLSAAVQRRQFLAEEGAVGKVLEERTRRRVKDELLLQSFTFKSVKTTDDKEGRTQEEFRVDRTLYTVDVAKKQWKRKGYDGIWQEVFRSASGNSVEMDNSHFARFLKALPHAFIHKSHFPMQNADVIFAKMKEPKAKTISFPRFSKAILMLLNEKFADSSTHKETKGSEPVDNGDDFERFLRFMNRFKAEQKRDADAEKDRERRTKQRDEKRRQHDGELKRQNFAAAKIQALIRSFVVRQSGKAYMKLVRQTQAARAQRKKDDKVRASIVYKTKAAFGVSPALKSDTKQEIEACCQRFENIKRTLFLQRLPVDKSKPAKKRWRKNQKARVLEAARTWCDYDEPVKILKGEWKNCVGKIVSAQNLILTGSVLVYVPLANRSAVVRYEDIVPYNQDGALRQAYESPGQVALNVTRDFQIKISRTLEAAVRKARLLYLQTIEFNRITQYAWVVEYDKHEQKVEYWNVVLNRRVSTPPKTIELIERMELEDREKLEKRVELAKSKLVALLNPFQPKDKPKLALRRKAIVFISNGVNEEDGNTSVASLKREMEAIDGARFWHDKVVPNRQFGGKKAQKFLAVSPPKACWSIVRLFSWLDLHEDGGFEPHAKKLLRLAEELQVYVVQEVSDRFERSGDVKLARDKLLQLMNLKEATLQLLMTKDQRDAQEEEARQVQPQ
ncbi:hypothetical protein PC119_g16285 [Phytophthora cactorum]|nr:hypothetical protein PC111_g13781 [Phytophthora cactorum]KAG3002530.1 hypothetical protein PC119_g16285 [Phytophthora cactorum]